MNDNILIDEQTKGELRSLVTRAKATGAVIIIPSMTMERLERMAGAGDELAAEILEVCVYSQNIPAWRRHGALAS